MSSVSKLMMSFILFLGFSSLVMQFPLSMGVVLLGMAMASSVLVIYLLNMAWYVYVYFIIMVGGVLVLFLYMAAISPSDGDVGYLGLLVLGVVAMGFGLNRGDDCVVISRGFNTASSMEFMYSGALYVMIMFVVIYLLMALFIIVRVVRSEQGPLRAS